MGVTVLHPYAIPEGKTGSQAMEQLTKRLAALGAIHSGQFIVDCETYILPQSLKSVNVLHNSEYPASTFSILDNGTKQIPLVADHLFDLLWMKITSSHFSKKQTIVESKGSRFVYGDFLIKLGNVTMMENFKGILIEVEYRPCLVPCNCWEIIRELLQGFLGQNIPANIPSYFTQPVGGNMNLMNVHPGQNVMQKQNEIYQPIDTICQYLEHFNNFRKQTSMSNMHMGQNTLRM
ncbi:mediator of RNA polymerase II transcription subunit 20 [Condylostylus longicornis]|uniref:mediator of RNA polymerase II transcription subunit 20 n=1 Tax=Condylostylus longicornis TaxID=2530218 RepID=UPI00244DE3D2|nr:mediator of RNA polymerase II transcription subunit 20 [Condylostylus longicornis]